MKKIIGYILVIALACSLVFASGATAFAANGVDLNVSVDPNQLSSSGGSVTATIKVTNSSGGSINITGLTCNGNAVDIDKSTVSANDSYGAQRSISISFSSGETAKALNFVLNYTDSSGAAQTASTATQVTKTSVEKVTGTVSVDSKSIKKGDKATFTFVFKNEGDVKIENASLKAPPINDGDTIGQPFSLNAGDSKTMEYTITVNKTIDVKPTLTYTANGSNKSLTLNTLTVEVQKEAAKSGMSLVLTSDKDTIESGGSATITATVTNTGNDQLTDVALMNAEGNIVETSATSLAAGESATATMQVNPTQTTNYEFSVSAKNSEGNTVDAKSNSLAITVGAAQASASASASSSASSGGQNLSIGVSADTNVLEKPGEVNFQITVANNSDVLLSSVSVTEPTLGEIGTISAMGKETKTFEKTVKVDKTTQYTFKVTATLEDGSTVEAQLDSPFTVTVAGGSSLGPLVILMIVIIIAIAGVGITLFVLYRKNKKAGTSGGVFGSKASSSKAPYTSSRRPSAFGANGTRTAPSQTARPKPASFEVEPKKPVRKPIATAKPAPKKGNTKFGDRNKF